MVSEDLYELGERAVIGPLYLWGKDTARKFTQPQVIRDAFAALALSRAGLIGAGTIGFVDVNLAFHL